MFTYGDIGDEADLFSCDYDGQRGRVDPLGDKNGPVIYVGNMSRYEENYDIHYDVSGLSNLLSAVECFASNDFIGCEENIVLSVVRGRKMPDMTKQDDMLRWAMSAVENAIIQTGMLSSSLWVNPRLGSIKRAINNDVIPRVVLTPKFFEDVLGKEVVEFCNSSQVHWDVMTRKEIQFSAEKNGVYEGFSDRLNHVNSIAIELNIHRKNAKSLITSLRHSIVDGLDNWEFRAAHKYEVDQVYSAEVPWHRYYYESFKKIIGKNAPTEVDVWNIISSRDLEWPVGDVRYAPSSEIRYRTGDGAWGAMTATSDEKIYYSNGRVSKITGDPREFIVINDAQVDEPCEFWFDPINLTKSDAEILGSIRVKGKLVVGVSRENRRQRCAAIITDADCSFVLKSALAQRVSIASRSKLIFPRHFAKYVEFVDSDDGRFEGGTINCDLVDGYCGLKLNLIQDVMYNHKFGYRDYSCESFEMSQIEIDEVNYDVF